jgi:aryl-alcohol dehydrogenase-like predicted oxidoreductase
MSGEKNATTAQISMAWMMCKKSWIVPIPGTKKSERLNENAGAVDVELSIEEVAKLDKALDEMEMSAALVAQKSKNRRIS